MHHSTARGLAFLFLAPSIAMATVFGCGADLGKVEDSSSDAAARRRSDSESEETTPGDQPIDPSGDDGGADVLAWPSCASKPSGVPSKSITDLWNDNPSTATPVWIPGVHVTAIARGACAANQACQLMLQQDLTYPSLAAAQKKSVRLFVSTPAGFLFKDFAVGDSLNVYGHVSRVTNQGQNELLVVVTSVYPGCAEKVGQGTPTPVTATLADLTIAAYENQLGPLLVRVNNVIGTPTGPSAIFGLGNPPPFDAGSGEIVSVSPFFLPGGQLSGLIYNSKLNFTSITGAFGMYIPQTTGTVTKYLVVYPRTPAEIDVQ